MQLILTPDQEFFLDTTTRFLGQRCTPAHVRTSTAIDQTREHAWWAEGAQLGWASTLATEELGGGSVSGDGLLDLTLVADAFGAHAAPGPLTPVNVVIDALTRSVTDQPHLDLVSRLVAGEATAAWCYAGTEPTADITVTAERTPAGLVLRGEVQPVGAAAQADVLLVPVRLGDEYTQVLVEAGAARVSVETLGTIDLTQRFGRVVFDAVAVGDAAMVGAPTTDPHTIERALHVALVVQMAETVGALGRLFQMTLEYTFDRYSFGRPLASYQAVKHRFADMATWLEAARATADSAARAVQDDDPESALLVSAAKAYIADRGNELAQECVQFHGGIGVTTEHDLHLYFRRVVQNSAIHGGVPEHRQRVARLIEARYL